MNIKIFLFALLTLFGSHALAQKKVKLQKLDGAVISGIVADDRFDIEIRPGDVCSVELELDSRLEPYLECELSQDGNLTLGYSKTPSLRWKGSAEPDASERRYVEDGNVDRKGGRMYRKGHAVVTVKTLKHLVVKSGSSIRSGGEITADTCHIELRKFVEPKNCRLNLSVGSLILKCSSAEGIRLSGRAEALEVDIENSKISLPKLKVETVCGKLKNSTLKTTAAQVGDLTNKNSHYHRIR